MFMASRCPLIPMVMSMIYVTVVDRSWCLLASRRGALLQEGGALSWRPCRRFRQPGSTESGACQCDYQWRHHHLKGSVSLDTLLNKPRKRWFASWDMAEISSTVSDRSWKLVSITPTILFNLPSTTRRLRCHSSYASQL
jgi:hypothetical protein